MQQNEQLVDLERLLPAAVAVAMHATAFSAFQGWLRDRLSDFTPASSPIRQDPALARAFSSACGRALWNGLPITAAGHAPEPIREPGRNEPCPCGSGQKYKHCCVDAPHLPIPSATLWPYVLAQLARAERVRLAGGSRVPASALGAYAHDALQSGRARDAIDVLEPRLGVPERSHGEDVAELVDLLCDAYDEHYSSPRRKIEFLESTTRRAPRSPLRSEAWQRLATIYMDNGCHDDAWRAVRAAQRDDPRSPALPLLEVHLLIAERRVNEARERAGFWIRTLERDGAESDDRRLEFLRRVRNDPLATLGQVAIQASGGAAQRLVTWLAACRGRPLPHYSLTPTADAAPAGTDARKRCELAPPHSLAKAERGWRKAFPLGKPFSIHDQPFEPDDVWAPETEDRWMSVLEAHPELFDSVTVLDDLATAVGRHPNAASHGLEHVLYEPLLERIEAIVARAAEHAGAPVLPWLFPENRPALRSLARRFYLCDEREDLAGALAAAEKLLRLNPDDNHGMRFELVNEYLLKQENEAALAVASAYPDDVAPETRFGRVLALVRLKRLNEAEQALRAARTALSKVLPCLLRARARRPKLSEHGVTIGGADQAWIYRDRMRSAWEATPGAMEWLRKLARLK